VTRTRPPVRLPPNLFGIPFGLCGLAQCWALGATLASVPHWPSEALWVLAGAVWLGLLARYLAGAAASGRPWADLTDPTTNPFTALIVIVPMLLALGIAPHDRDVAETVFLVALVLTVVLGAWLAAQWIVEDLTLAQWHPGYFLPTVAGGLIAAGGSAQFGFDQLAGLMFGYGTVCWIVLGSIILLRLFTQPPLPLPLVPTIAIEVAPPVVAGSAWFAINGNRPDAVALGLAGYAVLMVLVQLRLVPLYRRVPFGPGWWSFSFSYAAAFAVAIRWLAAERAPQQDPVTWLLLAVVTAGMAVLVGRTVRALVRGAFLPRPHPDPARTEVTSAPREPHAH
jgi:tellurite resistance protein